jgi:cell division protein FtsW
VNIKNVKIEIDSKKPLDTGLLALILFFLGLGLSVLYSASYPQGDFFERDPYFYLKPQFRFAIGGLCLMLLLSRFPYRYFLKWAVLLTIISLALLAYILIPGQGRAVFGATRWGLLLPFQPSEAAKLAVSVFLAKYFAQNQANLGRIGYGFGVPFLIIALFGGLIVLEKDLGGALVVAGLVVCLMIAAQVKYLHMLLFTTFIPVIWYLIVKFEHRVARLMGWSNPWNDPLDTGYAVIHSMYSFGAGGLTGVGPGQGAQKHLFLPKVHTDYVFSVIGEDFGFIGVVVVAFLFLYLVYRGFKIAKGAKDLGGYYLALGLTLCVGIPAFFNMFVALSIIPSKGLPLPFFSYGGSSLITSCVAMGILLNIYSRSHYVEGEGALAKKIEKIETNMPKLKRVELLGLKSRLSDNGLRRKAEANDYGA